MKSGLNRLRSPAVQGLLALLVGLAVLAGVVLYVRENYQNVPRAVRQPTPASVNPIAGWMTVRYVARTYRVPEAVLLQALGIDRQQADSRSLAEIAELQHVTTRRELFTVRAAIRQFRGLATPTPTPRRGSGGGSP